MKTKLLIATIILWAISIPIIILSVDSFIQRKDTRLKAEFSSAICDIFNGKEYIDIVYKGKKVSSEKISIPPKPTPQHNQDEESIRLLGNLDKKDMEHWQEYYGDLTKLYRIKNNSHEWTLPYEEEDGWNLIVLSGNYDGLEQKWIFPYGVGYKRQDYSFMYDYSPSIKTAVYETLDFFINNENSHLKDKIEIGSHDRLFNLVYDATNEYYTIMRDSIPKSWMMDNKTLWEKPAKYADNQYMGRITTPVQFSFMHNGYYRVFVGLTQPSTWSIVRLDWAVQANKDRLLKFWLISTGGFFLLCILILSVLIYKTKKKANETEYDKLKRLLNPKNFMNPYDKEKIEKSNLLYGELMNIDKENHNEIIELIDKATNELDISFIDQSQIKNLKKIINPQLYMEPYDVNKVSLANELYSILNKQDLKYSEFLDVKERSKNLSL